MIKRAWAVAFIFASCQAGAITPQEHFKCLDTADSAALTCHEAAINAADQADAMAAQNSSGAGKDSLNQASNRQAQVTQAIAGLLASARAQCQSEVGKCANACTGEYAQVGEACGKDIGKYLEQLTPGHFQNQVGHQGSSNSAAVSAQGGTLASGGHRVGGAKFTPSSGGGLAGGGSLENDPQANSPDDILQRPVGAETASSQRSPEPVLQRNRPNSDAGGVEGALPSGMESASVASNSKSSSLLSALRNKLQGEQLQTAILKYCGADGTHDQECAGILKTSFCSAPGRGACPTCQQRSPDQLEVTELGAACVATCARDPHYADLLADKCRALKTAGQEGVTREPAATGAEVGTQIGPSIFLIVSRSIGERCRRGQLRCGW